ncbi:hypothetical protein J2T57_002957 [Natronocella acetinitrilica]|uniref:Glycosyltransferase subfamily 4-like N-terminal domain-containing protein n=1 Tax=Natronocella acetinitrilica TaxID=414046 RepID=A0AAE3KGZ7_9GAMM|nr:glycosyltransferase [Natronocella acetinitrilica]MCP1675802.1 hypothetical protein [Natronocella acetinitrilica]
MTTWATNTVDAASAVGRVATQAQASQRRRILVVSPFLPPSTAVGGKRFAFLCREFLARGHHVEALSLCLHADEQQDDSLISAMPVHRARNLLPRTGRGRSLTQRVYDRLLLGHVGVPDQYVGWIPPAMRMGGSLIDRFAPEVIIATGPPHSSFVIGQRLAQRAGARLILDYRDPWTAFDWRNSSGVRRPTRRVHRWLEKRLVAAADALVFATERMRAEFIRHLGSSLRSQSLLRVITNGYEEQSARQIRSLDASHRNIVFAGELYGGRRVSDLMDGLLPLMPELEAAGVKPLVHVFGTVRDEDRRRVEAAGLGGLLRQHDPVKYADITKVLRGADVLYLPSGGEVSYALPFKVFDYLGAARPILAVTSRESAVADLMQEVDCGELAYGDSPLSVTRALRRLLLEQKSYGFGGREQFRWDSLATEYLATIDSVLKTT